MAEERDSRREILLEFETQLGSVEGNRLFDVVYNLSYQQFLTPE